jgi:hypothetical protein
VWSGKMKIRLCVARAGGTAGCLCFSGTDARSGESCGGTRLPVMVVGINQGVYPPLTVRHPCRGPSPVMIQTLGKSGIGCQGSSLPSVKILLAPPDEMVTFVPWEPVQPAAGLTGDRPEAPGPSRRNAPIEPTSSHAAAGSRFHRFPAQKSPGTIVARVPP